MSEKKINEELETTVSKEDSVVKVEKTKKSFFHTAKFRHGGIATSITVVFIIIAILFNIGAGLLVDRYPSLNWDMTSNKVNTLTEESIAIVNSIDLDTTIYILKTEADAAVYGNVDVLARKFQEINPKIKIEYIDLVSDPDFAVKYPSENLSVGDIIIETSNRYRYISKSTLEIQGEYSTYNIVEMTYATSFLAVSMKELPIIYVTNANNEPAASGLTALLKSNAFEVNNFNLMEYESEPNACMMIIQSPTIDFNTKQIENLEKFLENNGQYGRSVYLSFDEYSHELPNLRAFAKKWGINVTDNMVYELEPKNYLTYQYEIFAQIGDAQIASSYLDKTNYIKIPKVKALELESVEGISTQSLLTSSQSAFILPDDYTNDWMPTEEDYNQFTLLAYATKEKVVDGKTVQSGVIVSGSRYLIATDILQGGYSNSDFLMTIFREATYTVDENIEVNIPPVETAKYDLVLTADQINFYGIICFTVILPLIVLIIGLVVFFRRRHL